MPGLRNIYLLLCMLYTLSLFAQQQTGDTLIHLLPFEVSANRLTVFSPGSKIIPFDSASFLRNQHLTLADLLQQESTVFIKSYGPGALASTSFRGGNAAHTAVLWNGFVLNNAMNSQTDFSLFPLFAFNSVSLQYGGGSSLWGSGAVGGSIHLQQAIQCNEGLKVSAGFSAGSFKRFAGFASVLLSENKSATSIRVFRQSAANQFPYRNIFLPDSAGAVQQHAATENTGIMAQHMQLLGNYNKLTFSVWLQQAHREIPPNMLQESNDAQQADNALRYCGEWSRTKGKASHFVRAAHFYEQLLYESSASQIQASHHTSTVIAEAETRIKMGAHNILNVGLNNTLAQVRSSGYAKNIQQNRTAFFVSFRKRMWMERLQALVSARQEVMEGYKIPFVYSIGADYRVWKTITWKNQFARVYRLPGLNDLYWQPGGNPLLKPESGYSAESGLSMNMPLVAEKLILQSDVTYFSRKLENWIVWTPSGVIWSPQNLLLVWSRGVETQSSLSWQQKNTAISLTLSSNYVVSTNIRTRSANDASYDKQLMYVPMYSGFARMDVRIKNISAAYTQRYTGYRYTSTDNTEFLPPFYYASARMAYRVLVGQYEWHVFAQAENLFNTNYMAMLAYAMPLRHYNLGINIQFSKTNK